MQQPKMQQQGTTSVSISCLCITFGINCQMLNPVGLQMTLVVSALVNSRTLPLSISMVRLSTPTIVLKYVGRFNDLIYLLWDHKYLL